MGKSLVALDGGVDESRVDKVVGAIFGDVFELGEGWIRWSSRVE